MKYILSIDQGTSSTRSIIFDENANVIASAQKEHNQIFPQEAWVEHDPLEIMNSVKYTMSKAIESAKISWEEIQSIGIANQRETIVAWDKSSGLPLYNAIVWQCRRTANIVDELKRDNYQELFQHKTGLVLDAYFSGTKMKWLLENSDKIKMAAKDDRLAFGTIDSWIINQLTGEHSTDDSNASRTMVYNINNGLWDTELCEILKIPMSSLPRIVENASNEPFGFYKHQKQVIPIRGVLGDQQSALFGQAGFDQGQIKSTYGTGNFILLNTGSNITRSNEGLLSTVSWKLNRKTCYSLEGSVFVTGGAFQWLRDGLQIISSYEEIDQIAETEKDSGGVVFVPALVGLGAPHWDSYARGLIIGITIGTTKGHIVNATLDSIAFQTQEIIDLMSTEAGLNIENLRVDGGITKSKFLLQRQSDISQLVVEKPNNIETTALGVAMMAGMNDIWDDFDQLRNLNPTKETYKPKMAPSIIERNTEQWNKAVARSKNWV
ncbi:MAG: glycerol kinase GlpK [Candidatus Heimdallarchaeota archaeon]|nr:glycerol kinase GlpK [Candidatus Heimdallarchaeota archaeon]